MSLLEEIASLQNAIARCRESWDSLAPELFGSQANKDAMAFALIQSGAFRQLAMATTDEREDLLGDLLSQRSLQRFQGASEALQSWVHPPAVTLPVVSGSPVEALHAAAVKQKNAIETYMDAGEWGQVRASIEELLRYQLVNGVPETTAKSLCELALHAGNLGNDEMRLELARRAVEIASQDGWVLAQLAAACHCSGNLEEALTVYSRSCDRGVSAVALTGRAEVLKSFGLLPAALAEYDCAVGNFPRDIAARTGRAELLKTLERFDEALAAYDSLVVDFPYDVAAKTGRASVLQSLGRFEDSLGEYDSVVGAFSRDVAARNGRASVLEALGRFDEALVEYESIVRDFPRDVAARNGRANALKELGRFDESLGEYESIFTDFPQDGAARNGRASVLKAVGRFEQALSEYGDMVRDFPENLVSRKGHADVLKAIGLLDEAFSDYESIVRDFPFPQNVVGRVGMACVYALRQDFDAAIKTLKETGQADDWAGLHIHAMAFIGQDRMIQAQTLLERGMREAPFAARGCFKGGLAYARLLEKQPRQALEYLENDYSLLSNILRLDACGRLRHAERAGWAYEATSFHQDAQVMELRAELAARAGLESGAAKQSDQWILDREFELALVNS